MFLNSICADAQVWGLFHAYSEPGTQLARVGFESRERYRLFLEQGECDATLAGHMRLQDDWPTVGDWVIARVVDRDSAVIEGLLPRRTCFSRRAAGRAAGQQTLAANVDLAVVVVAFVAVTVGARVAPGLVLRVWALPAVFVVIGLVGVLVSIGPAPDDALWQAGPFSIGRSSLDRAVLTGARAAAGAAAVLVLALTTPMTDVLGGLRRVGVPAFLVEIAGVVYRMIFTLLDSVGTIRESQTARLGYATRRAALASTGTLLAGVLVRAWTRAQRLEAGLAGRGYTGDLIVTTPARQASWRSLCGVVLVVGALMAWAVMSR